METPIRFGVWGTGFIAQQLAADVSLVEGAVLYGIASRDLRRAKTFAATYNVARSYEGLEAMVADKDIDVVYIASPNHRHAADSLLCIHGEKAVLCEKPFAITEAEARKVVDTARDRHVFCMEAMWTRFFPAIAEVKRLITSGELGRIGLVQGNFAIVADPSGSRFASPVMGGGALLDLGVYLVSLSHDLLGHPSAVSGHAALSPGGADATCTFQLAWPNGTLAAFSASLLMNGTNDLLILGDRGRLRIPDPFYSPHQLEITFYDKPPGALSGSLSGNPSDNPPGTPPSAQPRFARPRPASVKLLRRRMSPVLALLRRGTIRRFDFAGNGYQFQLAEVVHCLTHAQTESAVMPLDDTLAVLHTLDRMRQDWEPSLGR